MSGITTTVKDFDENELDGLTDEERAAIEAEFSESEGDPNYKADAGDGGDAGDGDDKAAADKAAADAAAAAAAKKKADEEAAAAAAAKDNTPGDDKGGQAGETGSKEGEQPPGQPTEDDQAAQAARQAADSAAKAAAQDSASAHQEFNEAITAIDQELAGLGQQVEDGKMDMAQYHQRMMDLTGERQAITQEHTADLAWNAATSRFQQSDVATHFQDEVVNGFLQSEINRLAAQPGAAGMNYDDLINTAAQNVLKVVQPAKSGAESDPKPKQQGQTPPKDTQDAGKKADQGKNAKQQPVIPQTLGDVPAAAENGVQSDEFSDLDGLDGMDLEEALAKLPPDKADSYLKG